MAAADPIHCFSYNVPLPMHMQQLSSEKRQACIRTLRIQATVNRVNGRIVNDQSTHNTSRIVRIPRIIILRYISECIVDINLPLYKLFL